MGVLDGWNTGNLPASKGRRVSSGVPLVAFRGVARKMGIEMAKRLGALRTAGNGRHDYLVERSMCPKFFPGAMMSRSRRFNSVISGKRPS